MKNVFHELPQFLGEDDDPALWRSVLRFARDDISSQYADSCSTRDLFLVIGTCSSWHRPHQTRWKIKHREFAWPSGYGGLGHSLTGLPALDWCFCIQRKESGEFALVKVPSRFKSRQFVVRIAIPTQTVNRRKASVHLLWTPGTPTSIREPLVRCLAFARSDDRWRLAGSSSENGHAWRGEFLPPSHLRVC